MAKEDYSDYEFLKKIRDLESDSEFQRLGPGEIQKALSGKAIDDPNSNSIAARICREREHPVNLAVTRLREAFPDLPITKRDKLYGEICNLARQAYSHVFKREAEKRFPDKPHIILGHQEEYVSWITLDVIQSLADAIPRRVALMDMAHMTSDRNGLPDETV